MYTQGEPTVEILKHCIKMEGKEVPSNKDVTSLGMEEFIFNRYALLSHPVFQVLGHNDRHVFLLSS